MKNWIRSFIEGFLLPASALRLIIRHPSLLIQSSIPILITLLLYYYGLRTVNAWIHTELSELISRWGFSPSSNYVWIAFVFSKILLFTLAAFTFSTFATLIASPFNDWLSETAEKWATPPLIPVSPQPFHQKLRIIWIDITKTMLSTLATLSLILFSWIPILNLIALGLACALMTFQYVSYSQTRRGIGLVQGIIFLVHYPLISMGLGLSLLLGFSIPIISSFFLPLAVISGTLLYARTQKVS